jgi:hypothetical protein
LVKNLLGYGEEVHAESAEKRFGGRDSRRGAGTQRSAEKMFRRRASRRGAEDAESAEYNLGEEFLP